jgi:tetratricopeptide (TPR) repeat protein
MALKNFDSALADFNRAIELSPDMAWGYHGRGTTLMFQGKMLEAIDNFNRAIQLNPTIAFSWFNRGLAKVFLGNEAEAEPDFAQSLNLKPELKAEMERRIDLARHLRKIANSK